MIAELLSLLLYNPRERRNLHPTNEALSPDYTFHLATTVVLGLYPLSLATVLSL